MNPLRRASLILMGLAFATCGPAHGSDRPRAADLGVGPRTFPSGPLNALTDIEGIRVGHFTLREGGDVRTGVTAILPHPGNVFRDKVPAAIVVGNGFGKLVGLSQVQELGQLETPLLLTNTLAVWDAAAALVDHTLARPGNESVRSVNPVVGETNDGALNDIRGRHLRREHFLEALRSASGGPVAEGTVGAGTGTIAFGFKGGIGTASRRLPDRLGGYTVGALVQTNFGGTLTIDGVPVGEELRDQAFRQPVDGTAPAEGVDRWRDGSCMIVVATDAPLDARQLKRFARRALAGMARTGASFSHGSGDYVIAFSTAPDVRIVAGATRRPGRGAGLADDRLSPFFQAVAEATQEAIYNSLLRATTVRGLEGREARALPIDAVKRILRRYGRGGADR